MLREPAFWYAAGASLLLLFIFSHPIIWVPLVVLFAIGLWAKKKERDADDANGVWIEKDGVRQRWIDPFAPADEQKPDK